MGGNKIISRSLNQINLVNGHKLRDPFTKDLLSQKKEKGWERIPLSHFIRIFEITNFLAIETNGKSSRVQNSMDTVAKLVTKTKVPT